MSPASYQTAPPRVAAASIARSRENGPMRLGVEAALVGGTLVPGDVEIVDGRVAATGLSSPRGRGIAVPGFVDLQVNGFAGVGFLDADADGYLRAGDALLETGVTAYLPTLVTAPEEQLVAALAAIPAQSPGARVLGAHLEGPFLSPSVSGCIRPTPAAIPTRSCSNGSSLPGRSGSSRSRPSFPVPSPSSAPWCNAASRSLSATRTPPRTKPLPPSTQAPAR